MSHIQLITGGARSGKSSYAEHLLKGWDDVLYIATAIRTDKEMEERINHHIRSRNTLWTTYEGFRDLDDVVRETATSCILLDCVTNMISNLIFALEIDPDQLSVEESNRLYDLIRLEFVKLVDAVRVTDKSLFLVSNEVGMGLISEYKLGRLFVDFAGFINQYLAAEADTVCFMVSGLPLVLKGVTGLGLSSVERVSAASLACWEREREGTEIRVDSTDEASQGPGMTEEL